MSDVPASAPPAAPAPQARPNWKRRIVIGLVAAAAAIALVAIGWAALPRWWAQHIGKQVHGDLTTGVIVGFSYGFVALVLPVLVLALVYRFFRRKWLAWVIGGGIAVILAAPNLLTLWIAVGTGGAAHAADRTLDVDAPWFRGGMLIGVIAGAITVLFLGYVLASRRRAKRHADQAQAELRAARAAPAEPPAPPI